MTPLQLKIPLKDGYVSVNQDGPVTIAFMNGSINYRPQDVKGGRAEVELVHRPLSEEGRIDTAQGFSSYSIYERGDQGRSELPPQGILEDVINAVEELQQEGSLTNTLALEKGFPDLSIDSLLVFLRKVRERYCDVTLSELPVIAEEVKQIINGNQRGA